MSASWTTASVVGGEYWRPKPPTPCKCQCGTQHAPGGLAAISECTSVVMVLRSLRGYDMREAGVKTG